MASGELSLRWFDRPPAEVSLDLPEFLDWLGGSALFHLPGADRSRARLLSGGLHGNEPSGFHALHALLRDPPPLATDVLLFLGNARAACLQPRFTHRFVPGEEDMNRVWVGEPFTALRRLAHQVLRALEPFPLEAAVDLHNNSGQNPCYALLPAGAEPRRVGLARAWTARVIVCEGLALGTLSEGMAPRCPAVVVECGKCGCPLADGAALAGARRWLGSKVAWEPEPAGAGPPETHRALCRVEVPREQEVAVGEALAGEDLVIDPLLDRHNFQPLAAGTALARRATPRGRLVARDLAGRDVSEAFLYQEGDAVRLAREVVPIMITTRASIVKSDCLCYLTLPVS